MNTARADAMIIQKFPPVSAAFSMASTDEQAEPNGQWEINNQKTYTEQNTDTQCHERLSAEVSVHAVFYIVHHTDYERPVFLRYQVGPSFGNAFVIQ